MTLMDKLRALLETEDEVDTDEVEAEVDEVVADEAEPEVEADEVVADEVDEEVDEIEGTPADDDESPETAELRQQIIDQGALIETLRNQVAALGGDPIEDGVEVEAATESDEDVVTDFDSDYAEREARLAEMKGH